MKNNSSKLMMLVETLLVLLVVTNAHAQDRYYPAGGILDPDYDLYIKNQPLVSTPATFSWKDGGFVPASRDQLGNTCWAYASARAFESKILIEGGPQLDIAEQQLFSCKVSRCKRAGVRTTSLELWEHTGPILRRCTGVESCSKNCSDIIHCPNMPYLINDWHTVKIDQKWDPTPDDVEEIKRAIYLNGPGIFYFNVFNDFRIFWHRRSGSDYFGGPDVDDDYVYVHKCEEEGFCTKCGGSICKETVGNPGGHYVILIGWDDNKYVPATNSFGAFLAQNSWGNENSGPHGNGTYWIAYSGHDKETNMYIEGHGYIDVGVKLALGVHVIEEIYTIDNIFYVSEGGSGSMDGSSWGNAFSTVQDGIWAAWWAAGENEVWVSEGTYYAYEDNSEFDSFELFANIKLLGGFSGNETIPYDVDYINNETILSGWDGPEKNNQVYHVVNGKDGGYIRGFTITGGNANGSEPDANKGGGFIQLDRSAQDISCEINNCTFIEN